MRPDPSADDAAPPRVFISYAHDPEDPGHGERVLALANRLRDDGVSAQVDLYEMAPPEGWPKWCEDELRAAEFVIVVCTSRYRRSFERGAVGGEGRGVLWEAMLLRQRIYDGHPMEVVAVLMEGATAEDVPDVIARFARRVLPQDYVDLYRQLTRQPSVVKPALGERRRCFDNLGLGARSVFEGREEELAEIGRVLRERGKAAVHPAIVGLGGVGKTRLAIEYAARSKHDYDVRWRLRASGLASMQEDLVALGVELGIVSRLDDVEGAVGEVQRWLSAHERWLLVLDNAEEPALVRGLLPSPCPGHVLITSRARAWRGIATPIALRVLPPQAARELLLARSGRPDDGQVDALAEALGYLPLALVQAAAYIENTEESFGEYRRELERRGIGAFEDVNASPGDGDERRVGQTWLRSFEEVRERSPGAAALFEVLAFLDPDGVNVGLLLEHGEGLPEAVAPVVRSRGELNAALAELLRFSLVDREGEVLRVHRLVQQASRRALGDAARGRVASSVVRWVERVFAYVPLDTPVSQVFEGIVEQVLTVGSLPECQRAEGSAVTQMLGNLGHYRLVRGMLGAAKKTCRRSLAIAEALAKADPHSAQAQRDFSVSCEKLGYVEVQAGNLAAARDLFQRSLAIAEALAEADPHSAQAQRDLSVSLNFLGYVEVQAGNLAAARSLFQRYNARGLVRRITRSTPSKSALRTARPSRTTGGDGLTRRTGPTPARRSGSPPRTASSRCRARTSTSSSPTSRPPNQTIHARPRATQGCFASTRRPASTRWRPGHESASDVDPVDRRGCHGLLDPVSMHPLLLEPPAGHPGSHGREHGGSSRRPLRRVM